MNAKSLRKTVFAELEAVGFRMAPSLPLPDVKRKVRPPAEIAARLMALDDLFTWAGVPEMFFPSRDVRRHIKKNGLRDWLTKEECRIVDSPRRRAYASHSFTIGWKLESMWPLAWALGFKPEPALKGAQMGDKVIHPLVFEFMPKKLEERTVETFLAQCSPRPAAEVIPLEYRFYCAHNAVRSAQQGHKSVPKRFDPVGGGGVIHERRHGLTWCLSPGVSWDETDLST